MATTWIKALHRTNSGSISAALKDTLKYTLNPEKTYGGELAAAYECNLQTAESEFLLSKRLYEQRTGRNQGKHDVIGYHMRQSFKPGEVTPEQALKIGYELAMIWTKGKHQFIVTAHTNTDNPHTHIFFNSVTLDCSSKFQDFKYSTIALRRISDKLCLENGLSIIENPKLSKGYNRTEYLGGSKPLTGRDNLRKMIDDSLSAGMSLDDLLALLIGSGCEIKQGKQLSIKPPGSKKFFRLDALGGDYTTAAILERLSGQRIVQVKEKSPLISSDNRPNLLIDIQAKITVGAGAGYVQWMKIFNLQTAARTLMFLQQHGVDSYDELCEKSSVASGEFSALNNKIRAIELRQKEITELQKYIGQYGKTRAVYVQYKDVKNPRKQNEFYENHRAEIVLHEAAKKYFEGLEVKKLPSINLLKQEWATLDCEQRKLYSGYKAAKQNFNALSTAKSNADCMLGKVNRDTQNRQSGHAI